jgi:RND superfamily putative drug exporter
VPNGRTKVSGFPVISDELNTVISDDLRRAEAIAVPITAIILVLLFGSLPAVTLPLLFAFATISVAMGLVWLEAKFIEIPIYATSVVTLVGIALAVDYSMLYVARYREEIQGGRPNETRQSLAATARTAGRALIISGVVVAAGLIPLVFIPIPFFSGLGLAAVGIPLVSVLAAITLLPALLETFGPHLERMPISLPGRKHRAPPKHWASERLANMVLRHPVYFALGAGIFMVLVALPAMNMGITGGSSEFLRRAQFSPNTAAPNRSFEGTPLAPYEVLIDSRHAGAAWKPFTLKAERRLVASLADDPGVTTVQAPVELLRARHASIARRDAERLGLVDEHSRFSRIRIVGANSSGSQAAEALVEKLRSGYIPHAGFGSLSVWVGGPAAGDYDFVHAVTESVPILGLAIAVVMYCLLALMLRSAVLPLKAIAMSALSVAAACGVMVMIFEFGWGSFVGLAQSERIDAWVPVLLFAALFGISTDYEIFMVTRMREEWLSSGNNQQAVKTGLQLISRVITASALVMIVIFAGFTTSRVVALQQFGVGLVAGVFFDATVVRLLLVPSLMTLLGRWNWTFTGPDAARPAQQTASWEESR